MITCKREANKRCNNMYRLKNVLNSFLNTFLTIYKKKIYKSDISGIISKKSNKTIE